MGGKSKGGGKKGKANAQTRGKAPGGRVYEVAQAILNAPPGGCLLYTSDAADE